MKPPPFDFVAPTTLDAALDALGTPGAVVLAGGQSLLLELAYREVRPALLVDVNHLPDLDAVTPDGDRLHVGALVRHRTLEHPAAAAGAAARLLALAAPYVAHPPIRNRGTFCGSVAWAHPAAEWNAITVALDGVVHVRSSSDRRSVAAGDWYTGPQQTSRAPDELVSGVDLLDPPGAGVGFCEQRRTHASFALVAACVVLTTSSDGLVSSARVGLAGVGDTPLRASAVEEHLVGQPVAAAGAAVVADLLPHGGYLGAAATEVIRRAVIDAVTDLGVTELAA